MYPQHALNFDRRATCTFAFGIKRLNHPAQIIPGNDSIHLVKKLLAAGRLAKSLEAFLGKSSLAHVAVPRSA
jgi:hypothetical protein